MTPAVLAQGAPHAAPAGWRSGSYLTARVAGLPLSTVDALRCPQAAAWADSVLALHRQLEAEGAELSQLLYDLVNDNEDDAARRRLLALRRQVFNNTLPASPEAALAAVERARPSARPAVQRWLRLRARLAQLQDDGAAVFAADVARARAHLWQLADEPRLRGGLQLASPTLDEQLATSARPELTRPANKRTRRVERSLLSYLYRTACKTSPFSTFTAVALGRFDEAAPGLGLAVGEHWQRHVRLNVVLVARLADLISADPGRRGDLSVALSPGWRQDADRVRYVRHWVTAGDDSAAVSFDAVRDGLFFLRRSGVLDDLTALLRERGTIRCADLVDRLCAGTGAARADGEAYLSTLLRLGMLRLVGLDTDVHTPDPMRALAATVGRLDRPWARRLAGQLDEITGLVDAFPHGDLGRRRELLHRLRAALRATMAALGEQSVVLPQTLLYEDSRVDGEPLAVSAGAWRRLVGPDLAAVERILPAFDQNLPHRIMFHGFFLARFGVGGRCDDLLRLVEDFHDDLYDQYSSYTAGRRPFADDGTYTPEENWLGRPEMTALDEARQTFAARLRGLADADPGRPELLLPADLLDELAATLGDVSPGFHPQGHFVQLAMREPDPLVVLNQSFGGLSFPFSRFTHCFDGDTPPLAERLRAQASEITPAGAVFAELTGGSATTNLNLHARLTDYVIVCPGETSSVPAERQLTLDDLYLVHDPATDRVVLRSTRLDREVIAVYLGYLVPMALPQIPRTLLLLSPASMVRLDVWRGVPAVAGPGGVAVRPRVRAGSVVLSRRSWSARVGDLPAPGDPAVDPAAFLDWRRWRARHGVPRQVFATVHPAAPGRPAANPKPQYVDFDSPLSLQALRAALDGPDDRIVLREMLPAADELAARGERGDHVCELAVETFRTDLRETSQ
ncbi:lantibiotic dehydratase [Micromonospora sp. WMMD1082]|uniref:lantibiotic dehydratase n=1 Tax=Micromonospora sp. WMMD1082 TaxID=3016104 RepID=UPI002415BDC9|nr:lantibiotic dehydratase [Micromonospora sp. WMMD1082]MDG4798458.1 lantibiotic dehydratase [Micromonospora sp. WMMD1082]